MRLGIEATLLFSIELCLIIIIIIIIIIIEHTRIGVHIILHV